MNNLSDYLKDFAYDILDTINKDRDNDFMLSKNIEETIEELSDEYILKIKKQLGVFEDKEGNLLRFLQ